MNWTPHRTVERLPRRRTAGRTPALSPLALAALAAGLMLLPAAARANSIEYSTRSFSSIRILDLREGNLLFETSAGIEKSVPADLIDRLELDDHPALGRAYKALSEERYGEAVETLRTLYQNIEAEHLRTLVLGKLVIALDAAGNAPKAVQRYLDLLERDQSPFAKGVMPANFPDDPEQRNRLAQKVAGALEETSDPVRSAYLKQLLKRVRGEAEPPDSSPDRPGAEQKDPIAALLEQDKPEEALKQIEKRLQKPRAALSKLLYQRGVALSRLGRPRDAALAFMRVIIHFRPNSTEHYVPSLIGAGKAFRAMDKAAKARDLWQEAQNFASDQQAQTLEELLASLPEADDDGAAGGSGGDSSASQ